MTRFDTTGFTLVEVMVSVLLIAVGLGSIFAVNSESAHTLRAARQAAVASQILQQRIEVIRNRTWAEISSAGALTTILQKATESEKELPGSFSEVIAVSPVVGSESGPQGDGTATFRVRRESGGARVEVDGDLSSYPTLLVQSAVRWTDRGRQYERSQRSIICRAGLTRSGIFGSTLGRVRTASAP